MLSKNEEKLIELMYRFKFEDLSLSSMQINELEKLKKYIYSETMPNTFTKKIFENLVASNTINNGTLIYLDFNRIGANNAIYGKQEVTKAMLSSIDGILSILPTGTIPIRMGGDEFVFIVPEERIDDAILQEINSVIDKYSKQGKINEGISATPVIGYIDENNSLYDTYYTLSQTCAKSKERSITKILDVLRAFNFENSDAIIYCFLSILEAAKTWDFSDDCIDIELEEIFENISSKISKEEIDAIRKIIIATKQRILENRVLKQNTDSLLSTQKESTGIPCIQSGDDLIEALNSFTTSSWGIPKIAPFLDGLEETIPMEVLKNPDYKLITIEITHLKASNTKHGILKTDKNLQEIVDLITQTYDSDSSYYAALKGGKIVLFTNGETEKINDIIDTVQYKYLPFGLVYEEYTMPEDGWDKNEFLRIKEYFENNGDSQVKSLDITDSSTQAIIVDFFAKYIDNLRDDDKLIHDDKVSTIIGDMNTLYLQMISPPIQPSNAYFLR